MSFFSNNWGLLKGKIKCVSVAVIFFSVPGMKSGLEKVLNKCGLNKG